jgi:hypothetical protein
MASTSVPIPGGSKALAGWLERRVGNRANAMYVVGKLYKFYAASLEKEAADYAKAKPRRRKAAHG